MGKARRFLPIIVLFFLLQRLAIGQQPIHWETTIDSAKAAASQSNRLVLVFFCAGYCGPCHRMENELRAQSEAVSALEANFVPVKINIEYYPNTARQYGVTRIPTTVILAPNARGDVLAMISEYVPVDQYLLKLNKVAADAKQKDAGLFTQIQASPPVGTAVGIGQLPTHGQAPAAESASTTSSPTTQIAIVQPPPGGPANQAPLAVSPNNNSPGSAAPGVAAPSSNAPAANPAANTASGPRTSAACPGEPQKPAENAKRPANPLFGLDGFCPVQLVENSQWRPGKKAWGAIHRGRTYLFAGPDEQRRFLAQPDRYAPVSSGDDVVVLLEQGRSTAGCREHGLQFDGHVYLFASEETLVRFQSNPHYYAERALQAMRPAETAAVR